MELRPLVFFAGYVSTFVLYFTAIAPSMLGLYFGNAAASSSYARSYMDDSLLNPTRNRYLAMRITEKHNEIRRQVSPPAADMLKMQWSPAAAQMAQQWADQCRGGHNSAFERRTSHFGCGQNLLRTYNGPFSWDDVLKIWSADEIPFFRYGYSGHNPRVVGHYIQMIWAASFQVGCGYRNCGKWQIYVCHYCPSSTANYVDALRPYRAGSPCASCPGRCHQDLCLNGCPYENRYSNCEYMATYRGLCSNTALANGCKASCLCRNRNLLYSP